MISDRETRMRLRDENNKNVKEFSKKRETIVAVRADRAQKKYQEMESLLKDLQQRRSALMEAMISGREYAEYAKKEFLAERERVLQELTNHLKESHKRNIPSFYPEFKLIPEFRSYQLFYIMLSEADLDKCLNQLPEGTLTTIERDARIDAINKKIERIKKAMENDLESERKAATNDDVDNSLINQMRSELQEEDSLQSGE